MPSREQIDTPVDEQLIVEYYSVSDELITIAAARRTIARIGDSGG